MASLRFHKVSSLPTSGYTVGDVYYVVGQGIYVATSTSSCTRFSYANDASTSAKGVTQLSDAVNSSSSSVAATSAAVKTAYDKAVSAASAASTAQTTAEAREPKSTAVRHAASTAVGSTSKPVYVDSTGAVKECSYTIQTSVPSDAVFTDTHNSHKVTFSNGTASDSTGTSVTVVKTVNDSNESSTSMSASTTRVNVPTLAVTNGLASRITSLETKATTGMQYKGTRTDGTVPATGKVGDVYKVTTKAITGVGAEIGDFIVCNTATTSATDSAWDVWQANVNKDAYWDTNTPVSGNFVAADGTTGKIKDSGYNFGSFALASHNQASSTINAMTGYAISTSSAPAAISTSDSLNVAIGKLEKKVNNAQSAADGREPKSTAVRHTAGTAAGSATQPVYVASDGTATACTYTLGKSVPSDAVFTDTHHTYAFTITDGSKTAQSFTQNAAANLAIKASASGSLTASTSAGSGTLTVNVSVASGYTIPLDTQITAWNKKWDPVNATTSSKGIASFNSSNFDVADGAVSLKWATWPE